MDIGINWFNFSSPYLSKTFYWKWLGNRKSFYLFFRPWNFSNRKTTEGHFWGFGLFQINNGRHLFYIGHSGNSFFFIGKTP